MAAEFEATSGRDTASSAARPEVRYALSIPLEHHAGAQDYFRATEVSFRVVALVNHLATAEFEEQRLALRGQRLRTAQVLRAGYGSPSWMEVIQALHDGGMIVAVAGGLRILVDLVKQIATLPASVRRPYLENTKLRQELDAAPAAMRIEAPVVNVVDRESARARGAGAGPADDSPEIGSAIPTIGPGGVVGACDFILSLLHDDGSPEFSTLQATIRRAQRDAQAGRLTNEVRAVADLFAFVQAGGTITEKSDPQD